MLKARSALCAVERARASLCELDWVLPRYLAGTGDIFPCYRRSYANRSPGAQTGTSWVPPRGSQAPSPPPAAPPPVQRAPEPSPEDTGICTTGIDESTVRKAAQSVTAGMFPWERRQMEGGNKPLNRFERMYWGAFAGAMLFLVAINGWRYLNPTKEPKVDEDLEERKRELALRLAQGKISVLECEDVFEGMDPEELETFIDSARQRTRAQQSISDEYEGLSPDEINEMMASRAQMHA